MKNADLLRPRQATAETDRPRKRLALPAPDVLLNSRWPGNVRERENTIRRAAALSEAASLDAADFASLGAPAASPGEPALPSTDNPLRTPLKRREGKMDFSEIADRRGVSRKTFRKPKRAGP
jgi:DNA-binding NtrC family response regulator